MNTVQGVHIMKLLGKQGELIANFVMCSNVNRVVGVQLLVKASSLSLSLSLSSYQYQFQS